MIVNIRGTHGSGKSTIARKIRDRYSTVIPTMMPWRKRPFGYTCKQPDLPDIWIPGHYDTPCGGCDSIGAVADMFAAIDEHANGGEFVLFEGILAQHSVPRVLGIKDHNVHVICLDIPVDDCKAAVDSRRAEKGKPPLAHYHSIEHESRSLRSSAKRLTEAGIAVYWLNREAAEKKALELLGWSLE